MVASPLLWACVPFEFTDPLKLATPEMPELGSINPDAPASKFFTSSLACTGVMDASFGLIGPAVPSRLIVPPPGNPAANVKGNCEV